MSTLAGGSCQCFIRNLRTAQCEMDLLVSGALVWGYLPWRILPRPGQAAWLVLALLSGISPCSGSLPQCGTRAGRSRKRRAGCWPPADGVRLVDVRYDHDDVRAEAEVTNPAEPGRGHVRISEAAPSGGNACSPVLQRRWRACPRGRRAGHRYRAGWPPDR